jgi:hypothetical protein
LAYVEWELPHKKERASQLEVFKYSNSTEFLVTPDAVRYDKTTMTKLMYDLILGCRTMIELKFVLDFRTKENNN